MFLKNLKPTEYAIKLPVILMFVIQLANIKIYSKGFIIFFFSHKTHTLFCKDNMAQR